MASFDELRKKMNSKYGKEEDEESSQGYEATDETRNSFSDRKSEMDKKFGRKHEVDDKFIDSFITDANTFLSNSQSAYDGMKVSTASGVFDTQSKTVQDLSSRSSAIHAWLRNNEDKFDAKTLSGLYEQLGNIDSAIRSTHYSFYRWKEYYSQWGSEDEYNLYLEAVKQAEEDEKRWAEITGGFDPTKHRQQGQAGWDSFVASQERAAQNAAEAEAEKPWWEKLLGYLGDAGSDTSLPVHTAPQVSQSYRDQEAKMQKPDERWTEEEKLTFGYLWDINRQDAYAYAYALNNKLNTQQEQEQLQQIMEMSTDNFWAGAANTVGALLTSPFGLADYLGDVIAQGTLGYIPEADGEITPFEYSQAVTGGISQHLNKEYGTLYEGIPIIGGKGWGDVYGLGTSIAQSSLSAIGGPGQALITFFGSAAAAGVDDALSRGASGDQAVAYGSMLGLAEGLAEMVGVDNLMKIGSSSTIRQLVGNIIKQGAAEGIEEGITGVLNNFADNLIMRDKSNFNALVAEYMKQGMSEEEAKAKAWLNMAEDVAFDMLGGFVSGAAHSGPLTAMSYANTQSNYTQAGKTIMQAEGVDALKNLANEVAGVSDAKMQETLTEQAGKVTSEMSEGKGLGKVTAAVKNNINANRVGRLYDAVQTANNQANASANQADIAKSLERKGFSTETANDIAEAVVASYNGQELTNEQRKLLKSVQNNQVVRDSVSSIMYNAKSTMGQRSQNIRDFQKDVTLGRISRAYGVSRDTAQQMVEGNFTAGEENGTESHYEVSVDGKTIDSEGNAVSINGVSFENGRMVLVTEDGNTIDASSVSYGSQTEALVYESVANLGGIIDTDTANKLSKHLMKLGGATSNVYVNGIVQAYTYGYYGYGREAMTGNNTLSSTLTEAQRNVAYGLGEQYRNAKTAADQAARKNQKTGEKSSATGKVHFDGDRNSLTKRQRVSLTTMEKVAEALGVQIYVFESEVNESGKHIGANGWYDPKDGSIHIDLHAGANGEGTMLFTVAHELTHFIRQWSPAKFKILADFLMQEYGKKGVNVDTLVREQMAKAERNGRTISYDTAYEEVVADSMEMMLSDGKVMEKLAKLKVQDNSLWKKIKDFIAELAAKIRAVYKGMAPDSVEGRFVAEMVDAIDKLQDIFTEGLVDASENFQSSLTPGEEGVMVNQNGDLVAHATADGSVQLSMRTYEEDGREAFQAYLQKCVTSKKLTKAEMQEMLDGIEEIYQTCKEFKDKYAPFSSWSDAAVVRDTYGKPVFSVVTPNGDYKMNLDFSLVCKKRRTLDAVFNEMSRRGIIDNFELGQKSVVKINEIIRKHGFETACALCFVDAKRFRQASMADSFTRLYNELVESLVPEEQKSSIDHFNFSGYETIKKVADGIHTWDKSKLDFSHIDHVLKTYGDGTVEYKAAKYIKTHAEGRKLLLRGDFMSSQGFDAVKTQNQDILKLYNSKKGTGGPKAAFGDVQYMNEIIQKARWWTPAKAYSVGGVRIQSFSDYVPRMVFDYVQMVYDLAATKLPAHAYTKEALFVKQFGLTGIKINMSLIPAIVEGGIAPGLDANGNYVWAGESFDYETAKEIQSAEGYTENCGTICVGVSYEHIVKLLRDPNIRMVIPYHKSGLNPIVAHMNKIAEFTDYTNDQRTKGKDGKALEKDFDFSKALHDMGEKASPKAVADQYLKWCAAHGYTPRFAEFAMEDNYYKLLEDFTLYDKDGNYVPQREVRAVFPKEGSAFGSMKNLIQEGLQEDAVIEGKRDSSLSAIVDEIQRTLPKTEAEIAEDQVEQADRDLEEMKLSDRDLTQDPLYPETEREKGVFNREFINKISGLKPGQERDIIINTGSNVYVVRAYGTNGANPYTGEILGSEALDDDYLNEVREELNYGTNEHREGNDSPAEAIRNDRRRGNGGHRSVKERLEAEGYGHLLEDESDSYSKGNRGQSSGDSQSEVKLSDRDNAPTFYSQMAKVIDAVKQEKLGAASVVNMLRGKGVKAEEIKWSGIEEWLEGKKSVTKAELQEFIAGSMLQIEEETLDNKDRPYSEDQQKRLDEYEAKRDEVAKRLADEWKKITGEEFPIRNAGAGLESAVTQAILEANSKQKNSTFEGRLLAKLRKDLQKVIENNDDFGFYSWKDALRSIHRHRRDFVKQNDMSTNDKAVIVKYCNALNAYNELPNMISEADTDRLRAIAREADPWNRKIMEVKHEHNEEEAKYMTNWGQYRLDGGKNYREMLFRIPGSTYSNAAMFGHWKDRSGVLAHARVQDMDTFIGKMLFIEEIQSDWHNEGHKEGYRKEDEKTDLMLRRESQEAYKEFYAAVEKMLENNANWEDDNAVYYAHPAVVAEMFDGNESYFEEYGFTEEQRETIRSMVAEEAARQEALKTAPKHDTAPDAPFKDTYHEYVLKRLIRMAAEQDYDSIGWTTAETQDDRWQNNMPHKEGTGKSGFLKAYTIEYDQEIPKFLSKLGKKWGAKVGKTVLDNGTEVWSMAITDEMKESVLTEGQPLYSDRDSESVSNRSLLANALEGAAKTDIEKQKIQEYKGKIDLIEAEEQKLRELNEKIKELSFAKGPRDTKAIRGLQFEARQTANRINTYDKQLLRLEASKPLQDVLTREKQMAYKRAEQKGKEALAAYREKAAKTQRDLLEKWQESRKKGIDSRNRTAMRHKIKDVVNELNQYLLRGTKDRHVPIELQKAVAEALDAVNMDTVGAEERIAKLQAELMKAKTPEQIQEISRKIDHIQEMGDRMNGKLKKLKDAYDQFVNSDDPLIANSHDEVISNKLQSVIETVGNTPLRDMTLAQLEDVYDMYRMVLTTIRNANKAFTHKKVESIAAIANLVMMEVERVGGKKKLSMKGMNGVKGFVWNNLKPVYAFEHIGSDAFTEVFNNVRAGEDVWAVDVTEAREFYLDKSKKHNYGSWDFKKRYKFTSSSGMDFELNLEQIMSLYAYSKRDQAAEHLKKGGIVIDETTEITIKNKLGIQVKFNPTEATAYNISDVTLDDIISKLTDEQKSFVDEMQEYLSTVMGAKGNEVSLVMYGVKLFKEKFYFPLKSAQQFMAKAKEQQQGEVKIKNSGFSKETVQKASNPIVLTPFMNVWANHVNEMSMYHAFVLPMEDFYRVYNYKTPTSDTMATESVEMFIQNAYGKGATKYIDQLLKDLNGGARTDHTTGIINKMMGLFKKGAVFASLSVVVQQPSAIARAAALMDTKYFIGPKVDRKRHKVLWDEVKQYAPVAVIKEMGYFDTNMGKSTQDFIMGKEYSGFTEKMKALVTDSNYRDEILSKAPALADELAWCSIWEAVKRETKANNPGMDVKSEAFLKKAGERFTEVIVKTQVYDSVLSRSGLMRSKDTGMKMATAFMAEPTTSINMIADALLQSKRGNKKYARNAIGAVIASQILNSILVSFVYAARDDDEDETYWEKYLGTLTGEVLDSLNPLTYIPFIKDIVSIVQGYDVERSDMAIISDLWKAYENLSKDSVSPYRKVEGFAGSIAQIFGLPVKNIMRDVRGIYQTIESFMSGQQTTGAGIGHAIRGAVTGKDVSNQQQLYEAHLSGDKTQIARVEARYKDKSAIQSAIRKGLRENDTRIREAAIAWNANDLDEYMRIAKEIIAEKHFSQDDIVMAIRAEANALTPDSGTTSSTSNAKGLFTAEKFASAIAQGDQATAYAIKTDIIQTAQKNGKTADEAEKSFNSSAKAELKELFLAGEISEQAVINALTTYCGADEDDALADVQYWDFKQRYPDVYADDAWFDKYYEEVADSGIGIDMYMDYRNQVKDITGEGKKERRMAVIDSLPITSSQKDALYYAEGWAASTLNEAPWH